MVLVVVVFVELVELVLVDVFVDVEVIDVVVFVLLVESVDVDVEVIDVVVFVLLVECVDVDVEVVDVVVFVLLVELVDVDVLVDVDTRQVPVLKYLPHGQLSQAVLPAALHDAQLGSQLRHVPLLAPEHPLRYCPVAHG